MYKNCGLTCILVVQELNYLCAENISVCSQMRKLQSISLLYLPTQVTKSHLKTRYFSLATLPAEYVGQTTSNLKLLRSTEWRNLYIQASFPVPYNLFQRLQFHYHSWAIKTLKMQAPCETVSHEIYRPAIRYQCVSELGFRSTLGNWQCRSNLRALPTVSMFSFISIRYFDFVFWYLKNND